MRVRYSTKSCEILLRMNIQGIDHSSGNTVGHNSRELGRSLRLALVLNFPHGLHYFPCLNIQLLVDLPPIFSLIISECWRRNQVWPGPYFSPGNLVWSARTRDTETDVGDHHMIDPRRLQRVVINFRGIPAQERLLGKTADRLGDSPKGLVG